MYLLAGLLLEPGDEVVSILRECKEVRPFCPGAQTYLALLQTTESHLGAGNVLLGVLKVVELQSRAPLSAKSLSHQVA